MVTAALAVTVRLVTVKFAVVAPASTVTVVGTVAALVLPLVSATSAPPLGAAPLKLTVPWAVMPPVTLMGLTATEDRLAGGGGGGGGCTVSAAVRVTPLNVAETTAVFVVATDTVLMVKLALIAPAATVTLAGTVATFVLALDKATIAPVLGAAPVKVTVPCAPLPPVTLVGLTVTEDRLAGGGGGGGGRTESVAVRVTPLKMAETTAVFVVATDTVLMVKLALVAPAATVTLTGTVATAAFPLESETTAPPLGAPLLSVTVPCEALPPTTEFGFTLTADKLAATGAACAWKRREAEKGPATPAELMARTRHQSRVAGSDAVVNCDTVTVWFTARGAVNVSLLAI
jgi:hypothetical protein